MNTLVVDLPAVGLKTLGFWTVLSSMVKEINLHFKCKENLSLYQPKMIELSNQVDSLNSLFVPLYEGKEEVGYHKRFRSLWYFAIRVAKF